LENKRRERPASRPPRHFKKKKQGRRVAGIMAGIFGTLLLIGVCTTVMLFVIFMQYVESLKPVLQVDANDYTMNLSSMIYYRDSDTGAWKELQRVHGTEDRIWVDIQDMPEEMWQAAVAIEDERFFLHEGVDWWRTGGAVVNMFVGMKNTFGGSTITQQTLKNITEDDDPYVNRKVREIFRALEFEKNYTKWEILELYLNNIYLGAGCYGVETAAEYYFGKEVSELNAAECASLIAITNNPSRYGPMNEIEITVTLEDGTKEIRTPRELNKQRQEMILTKMSEVGADGEAKDGHEPFLTAEEAAAAKAYELPFTDGSADVDEIVAAANNSTTVNDWFVEQVIKEVARDLAEARGVSVNAAQRMLNNGGYQIYTTMDYEIQKIAEKAYENRANLDVTSAGGEPLQSGITIMDPGTGHIVAMVGCVGPKEGNLWTNYATEQFQVGSSIKPLTCYAPTLDAGTITPATVFDNYPVRLLNETPWPKNSPNTYTGRTMVSTGVQNSINTVAVQTLETLGYEDAYAFATENLHLSLVNADMDASPLAMGGLTYGLSTVEMTAAYSAFVNEGIYTEPVMYLEVRDASGNTILTNDGESHIAMKETTAYFINDMLTKAVQYGTGTAAQLKNMTVAGKTGTTTDNRARYFVGYTPYYCAAVWTGYRTNEKISYSGNPAITMWKLVMEEVHENLPNKKFAVPATGLTEVTVCRDSGLLHTGVCASDMRGSRAITVTVPANLIPTETCDVHVMKDYCTEGKCLATADCPAEAVKQVAFMDVDRPDYYNENGYKITATDDAYTLVYREKQIGLRPTIKADGTKSYPNGVGCPAHSEVIWMEDEKPPEAEIEEPEEPELQDPEITDPEHPEPEETDPEAPVITEPEDPEISEPDEPFYEDEWGAFD